MPKGGLWFLIEFIASGLSNREVKSNFAHLAVLHAAGRHITLARYYAMVGQAFLGADMGDAAPV